MRTGSRKSLAEVAGNPAGPEASWGQDHTGAHVTATCQQADVQGPLDSRADRNPGSLTPLPAEEGVERHRVSGGHGGNLGSVPAVGAALSAPHTSSLNLGGSRFSWRSRGQQDRGAESSVPGDGATSGAPSQGLQRPGTPGPTTCRGHTHGLQGAGGTPGRAPGSKPGPGESGRLST